jgi:hypothetical protein
MTDAFDVALPNALDGALRHVLAEARERGLYDVAS